MYRTFIHMEWKRTLFRWQIVVAFMLFIAAFIHIVYLNRAAIPVHPRYPALFTLEQSNPFIIFLDPFGSPVNGYMPLILPLVVMLISGDSLFVDYKTGFYQFALPRTTHKRYITGKILSVALITFIILFAFQVIAFLYCLFTSPYFLPTAISRGNYMSPTFLPQLYIAHPYRYVLLIILLTSMASATLSILGIVASNMFKNIFMVVSFPWVAYVLFGELMMFVSQSSNNYLYRYSPIQLIGQFIFIGNYSVMGVLLYWLMLLILLAWVSYKLSIRKFKQGFLE